MMSLMTARQLLPLRRRLDCPTEELNYIPSTVYEARDGWAQRMERLVFRLFHRLPT